MSPRLSGRRAIVTGGARGIGRAIVRRLAAEGADVAVLDRLNDEGRAAAASVDGSFHSVDLAHPEEGRRAVREAIDRLGGVDVLVNSAGILRFSPLIDVSTTDFAEVMQVNAVATLLTMQEAARSMIAAEGGSIVNLASMAAKHGGADQGAYTASKAAVVALTRVAALEWGGHGIRVNCLCPGYVLTEMGAATRTPEDVARWSSSSPLGRLGEPEDVADVAAFLASDDSRYMTGQAINVTGGMIMH